MEEHSKDDNSGYPDLVAGGNVDTSYVLCDRGLYNLPSLVSVADPHFWDPEA
jgi:hypothetical protein